MNSDHLDRLGTDSSDPSTSSAFPLSVRKETLLVVDDDELFRALEVQILCAQGFRVLQAETAEQALWLAEAADRIDLLLTDFKLPGADGWELTRRFRIMHPETPVLMVSGSLPEVRENLHGMEFFEMLEKPFVLAELLRKIRCLLEATVDAQNSNRQHA
jgi:DNA-binding response OmpR family regulator